jgi:hypothetical protein
VAVADAPILALEVLFTTAFLVAAAGTAPGLPWWAGAAGLAGSVGLLLGLRSLQGRGGPATRGLSILWDGERRGRLALIVTALCAVSALRVLLVLAAFGLPHGPADVAVMFTALGVLGLLPIGAAAGPAGAVAVDGGHDLAAAAAAGVAISATAAAAVVIYAALVLAAVSVWRAQPETLRSGL